ncbi:MAG TPA: SH3 domain-containing protein, partial [Anaerolineales bacterium]|nr:SH3 domain-containing protein [Anaerolineales bacterium]
MQTLRERSRASWARVLTAALLLAILLAGCAPTPTPLPPPPPTAVPQPTAVPPTPTPVPPAADPNYYPTEPVMVMPPGVAGQPMVTAAYNTAVLSGPGGSYVVYGAILGGQTAVATGVSQDGQWYVISVPVAPGGSGWVSAVYVLPQNTSGLPVVAAPPVPPSTALVPPGPSDPQAKALVEVYVRSGPADNSPAYGIAKAGAIARVLGKSQDGLWLTVRLDPAVVGLGYGWVNAAYTEQTNTQSVPVVTASMPPAPPVQTTPPASGAPTATAIDYVNLRSGPGTNYYIVGVAAPGQTGEVVGKSQDGGWWVVKAPTDKVASGQVWVSAG